MERPSDANGELDPRVRRYVSPTRVVWMSDRSGTYVHNAQDLLARGNGQAVLAESALTSLKGGTEHGAAILLDFGRELHGGLSIVTGKWQSGKPLRTRVRFGESVSEAMAELGAADGATNDHAIRDYTVQLPWLGAIEIGSTGFRFVRIDLLEPEGELLLKEVRAIFVYRDLPYLGSFHSSDARLDEIWLTGAYTVHLNMQTHLWDGIKRDRLVWIGDMHPEVMTISSVFGASDVVTRSLDLIRDMTPLPQYMNGISSYSLWWILIQRDLYRYRGDLAYLRRQQPYLDRLLDLLLSKIKAGEEQLDGWRFLDWSTVGDSEAVHAGLQALMVLALDAGAELSDRTGEAASAKRCRAAAAMLRRHVPQANGSKQATALLALAGMISPQHADTLLSAGGARGYSTFYGYYILQALAKAGDYPAAMDSIRTYWGAMLELGATSFWEDFDLSWAEDAARVDELVPPGKRDVHASYGRGAFKKLRMSLAHGWASGPTAWLTEHVLGVSVVEPGARAIRIQPHLGDLTFVEGSFPTPYGLVRIRHDKRPDGSVSTRVDAPPEVMVLQ